MWQNLFVASSQRNVINCLNASIGSLARISRGYCVCFKIEDSKRRCNRIVLNIKI